MTYREFNKLLKEDMLSGTYLLYGEEEYLKQQCLDKIDAMLPPGFEMLNKTVLEGAEAASIYDAAIIAPLMCEKRIVIAKDPLFITDSKPDESETDDTVPVTKKPNTKLDDAVSKLLSEDLSSAIVILYVRGGIDKRKKAFKLFDAAGRTVEFSILSEDELINWIMKETQNEGGKMSYPAAKAITEAVGGTITEVLPEIRKLVAYKKTEFIDKPDVEALVSISVEASVFAMIDSLFSANKQKAYELLEDMLLSNEQPIRILNLISRQLRLLTYAKSQLSQGISRMEIQRQLELKGYGATKIFDICAGIPLQWLSKAYTKSIETDYLIKSGKIGERQGLDEMISLLAAK